ncbi:unnamed protein product [Vitrella brassicaformis CCMP3155]|uniref:CPW-WPC domain-containing protein n=1 Tax=Vitrella brassicaformis (strain CCMP3155) TaxID=1169540 RepID=A0A0G4EX19_VITBC|nr:unnamed protein product [Vitrella brassicaformis CCMP3155]|eukprot:CEM03328.1 unnamed protein product [Vitrella brassicaformis CCMP3155]
MTLYPPVLFILAAVVFAAGEPSHRGLILRRKNQGRLGKHRNWGGEWDEGGDYAGGEGGEGGGQMQACVACPFPTLRNLVSGVASCCPPFTDKILEDGSCNVPEATPPVTQINIICPDKYELLCSDGVSKPVSGKGAGEKAAAQQVAGQRPEAITWPFTEECPDGKFPSCKAPAETCIKYY